MEPALFCESCTMPIENIDDKGTQKDGSKSNEYCKYCYQNGSLVNPGMAFDQMKAMITNQMQKQHMPEGIIQQSMDALPHLKRWLK